MAAGPSLKNVFVILAAGQITVTNGRPAPQGPWPIWFDFGLSVSILGPPLIPSSNTHEQGQGLVWAYADSLNILLIIALSVPQSCLSPHYGSPSEVPTY